MYPSYHSIPVGGAEAGRAEAGSVVLDEDSHGEGDADEDKHPDDAEDDEVEEGHQLVQLRHSSLEQMRCEVIQQNLSGHYNLLS